MTADRSTVTGPLWRRILAAILDTGPGYNPHADQLGQENALLRSLAYEFRVPLTNQEGGYGEVVVRRWTLAHDLWEITDGANTNRQVWINDKWQLVTDVGLTASHQYPLDEALTVAHQVAEYEGATFEAWVRATRPESNQP